MSKIHIYTDGGADPNPGSGGWGAVLIHPSTGERRELSGGADSATNNQMELLAAIVALETLDGACDVQLFTDSTYLRQGITKWIRGWRAAGWKRRDGQAVKNVDLWQRLDQAASRHKIDWRWVKGHAGIEENERADQLATAEIQARKGAPEAVLQPDENLPSLFLKITSWPAGGLWEAIVRSPEGDVRHGLARHCSRAGRGRGRGTRAA
jgi:ribonuclease HI